MQAKNLNPYTQAIWNCLQQFKDFDGVPQLDEKTSQFLANMIQGRFLQYLVTRMCEFYRIQDKDLEKQLTMVLMSILGNKFFNVFREKVKAKPDIVYQIAAKIAANELVYSTNIHRTDGLYSWICKKYFEYRNFNVILKWINSNPEVEKIVFLSKVQNRIKDSNLVKALFYITRQDKDAIAPAVFNRYLDKNRLNRLESLVNSGDWKIEAAFVRQETSRLIAWRNYMSRL